MPDDTRVWWSSVDAFAEGLTAWLDPGELERARRYRHEPSRREFVVAAVLARVAVANCSGGSMADVVLDRHCPQCGAPHGRPTAPGSGVHLSVAHSAGTVVVATTTAAPVGIDVQRVADVDDGIRPMMLAPGETAADRTALARVWARKESVLKATGDGLRVPMVSVHLTDGSGGRVRVERYDRVVTPAWRALDLNAPAGWVAAVCRLADTPLGPRTTALAALPEHPDGPDRPE